MALFLNFVNLTFEYCANLTYISAIFNMATKRAIF